MSTPYAPPPRRAVPPPPPLDLGSKVKDDESRDTVLTGGLHARMASLNLNQVGLNPSSRPTLSTRKVSRTSSILSSPSTSALSSPSSFSTLSLSSTTSQSSLDSQSSGTIPAEIPQDQLKQLLARKPPVPVPPVPSARPKSMHVTATPASPQLKVSSRLSLTQPIPLVSTDRIVLVQPVAERSPLALSSLTPTPTSQRPSRPLPAPPPPPPPPSCIPAHATNQKSSDNKFVPGISCIKCHDFSHVDLHAKSLAQESVTLSDELVHALVEPFETETEKARALFAWFYHTTSDEVKRIGTPDVSPLTTDMEEMKQVFVDICAGFADLFMDLARRAGLEAYFVWGYCKTHQLSPPCLSDDSDSGQPLPLYQNNDAWNCVKMDEEWHLIVPTWGRGFVSETESVPSFASRWFTSTPLEFRRTHFPEDLNYQLVSEDDGGSISWETFVTAQETGPSIDGEFYEHDLHPGTLQPHEANLDGGQFYTFAVSKSCEHFSTAYEDNYCFVLFSEGLEAAVPLVYDEEEGGWSVTVRVPGSRSEGASTIGLGAVWTVAGQDAKGLKPERFAQQEKIRKRACVRGLVEWRIV